MKEILFVFCFDVWAGDRNLALHPISQYTTYLTATSSASHIKYQARRSSQFHSNDTAKLTQSLVVNTLHIVHIAEEFL